MVLSVIRCAVRRASKQAMATGNSKQADRQGGDWRGGEGDVFSEGVSRITVALRSIDVDILQSWYYRVDNELAHAEVARGSVVDYSNGRAIGCTSTLLALREFQRELSCGLLARGLHPPTPAMIPLRLSLSSRCTTGQLPFAGAAVPSAACNTEVVVCAVEGKGEAGGVGD